ncbi:MAG: alpha/beta hydrolase [Planctomycetota bacterium]
MTRRTMLVLRLIRKGAPPGVIVGSAMSGCMPAALPTADEALEAERLSLIDNMSREVSYLRGGDPDEPRLIYVHGTPGSSGNMARYINNPVPGFEAIAIDRPGFGATGGGPEPSFEKQAAAIEPFLIERAGRWPVLVGHSLGGPIVARAAADYPGRVGAIVILAGSLDPALEEPRWYNHLAGSWPVRFIVGSALRTSNDEIMAAPDETQMLDAVLSRVTCPVYIVHGDRDSLVPVENVTYMERMFVNARSVESVVVQGEGHLIPWTQESLVRETVRRAGGTLME